MTRLDPPEKYPWYEVVRDATLEQGDILRGFEVVDFKAEYDRTTDDYDVVLETMNVVVMTQSCDIEQKKVRSVILCPLSPLRFLMTAEATQGTNPWRGRKYREDVRQGHIPGYHLISDFEHVELSLPVSVVQFHEIYSAPSAQVRSFIERGVPRLRLCPPYKEHLAQAFARFFMRVGLPVGIPREKMKAGR